MDLNLSEKVALITGASRGIGLHTARVFASEGCPLGICGRNSDALEVAADELRDQGVPVVAVQADVTDPADAARLVDRTSAELGRIDILVNNAGGFRTSSLLESTDEDWLWTFETNIFQVIRLIRLVVPHMRRSGGGAIVNIGSSAGWHPKVQVATHYSASKATIVHLTERLALDLVHENIRVNAVSPGSTIWPDSGWDRIRQARPEFFDAYLAEVYPMGRLGKPEEVAQVVAFLASPRASWINGRNIPVDGLEQTSLRRA
jgi:3-oxoacyl-[acyl-carrier protein] reductase